MIYTWYTGNSEDDGKTSAGTSEFCRHQGNIINWIMLQLLQAFYCNQSINRTLNQLFKLKFNFINLLFYQFNLTNAIHTQCHYIMVLSQLWFMIQSHYPEYEDIQNTYCYIYFLVTGWNIWYGETKRSTTNYLPRFSK